MRNELAMTCGKKNRFNPPPKKIVQLAQESHLDIVKT